MVITAAPELIIMMDGHVDHASRKDAVLSLPEVKLTPVGRPGGFATIPDAALGFVPRTAEFGHQLCELFYGKAE